MNTSTYSNMLPNPPSEIILDANSQVVEVVYIANDIFNKQAKVNLLIDYHSSKLEYVYANYKEQSYWYLLNGIPSRYPKWLNTWILKQIKILNLLNSKHSVSYKLSRYKTLTGVRIV